MGRGFAVVLAATSGTVVIPREWLVLAGLIAAMLVLVVLYEAIPEELVFRGLLDGTLAERWLVSVAVLVNVWCSARSVP